MNQNNIRELKVVGEGFIKGLAMHLNISQAPLCWVAHDSIIKMKAKSKLSEKDCGGAGEMSLSDKWEGEDNPDNKFKYFMWEDVKQFIKDCEFGFLEYRNIAQYKHPESKVILSLVNDLLNIIKNRAGKDLVEEQEKWKNSIITLSEKRI